jgi:hypothetical protein
MRSGAGRLAKYHGQATNFCVGLARCFLDMSLHEKGKALVVEAELIGRPARSLG